MTGDSWGFEEGEEIALGIRCIERLGGGPDNEVYLVWDEDLFSLVVAKLLRPSKVDDDAFLRRFLREADILESLEHPVVARIFGSVMSVDRPMLLIEHLDAPSLGRLIRKQGSIDMEQLLPVALQLCSALHYMHGQGFVHLDIKPDNLVMTAPPRLIDFSIARSVQDAAAISSPIGTDAYMSPEQCDPTLAPIGPPADVWGLGATLYHAICGRRPFAGREGDERFPQLTGHPDSIQLVVPEDLRQTIFACLEHEAGARPTPSEVALSLESLVSALPRTPILAPPKPRFRPRTK